MTILNYVCTPKRAVLAVDTAGTPLTSPAQSGPASKAIAFGAQNLVIASRGPIDVVAALATSIHAHALDFDALAKDLQQGLPLAVGHILSIAAAQSPPVPMPSDVEIVVLGWSAKRGRVAACYFKSDQAACSAPDFSDHKHLPNEGLDFRSVLGDPTSKSAMLRMMQRQKGWADSHGYQGTMGGNMIHFEVTKSGIAIDGTARI